MEENLLKKYKLEETQKRFQQICEYTFNTSVNNGLLDEEGEDDMQQPQQPQGNPNAMGGQQQPPMGQNMGNEPNGGGMPPMDEPNMGGSQQPPMNNDMGDTNGGMPMEEPAMGGEPNGDMPPMDEPMADNVDAMQPDDEVIDVDDLTQAQETTEYKIDGVNDKLTTLMNVLPKFIDALSQNDEKLNDLKAEIEKRNPTAEEQMNIRSQASYPYSETPKGYWEEKMKNNPNYEVMYNNEVSPSDEQKEFTLHKDELDRDNDKEIAKSFEYPQELKDILNF